MKWVVNQIPAFEKWFEELPEGLQDEIDTKVHVLEDFGPSLGRPLVDTVEDSAHSNMKELRVQYAGEPWRIFFAFDPNRTGILLIGGNKAGNKNFYDEM